MTNLIINLNGQSIKISKKTKFINIGNNEVFKITSMKAINKDCSGIYEGRRIIEFKSKTKDFVLLVSLINVKCFIEAKKINILLQDGSAELMGISRVF